jgi:hypothetical protein
LQCLQLQETSRILSLVALYASVALVQSKFALLAHTELPAGTDVDTVADEVATELMCLSATIERIERASASQVQSN